MNSLNSASFNKLESYIFDYIQEIIILLDLDGKILSVTKEFEKCTGYSDKKYIGKNLMEIIIPEDKGIIFESFQNIKEKESIINEIHIMSNLGYLLTFEIRLIPHISNNINIGYLGIAKDITNQKIIEEELVICQKEAIKAKTRLEYLIYSTPVIIYACELNDKFCTTFISNNVTTITGYDTKDFFSKKTSFFDEEKVHPEDRQRISFSFNQINEKKYFKEIYRLLYKDGTYHWIHNEAKLICDSSGQYLEIIGFLIDINDQKKTDDKLKASKKQYKDIIESLADPIHVIDSDFKIIFVNEAFCEQLKSFNLDTNVLGKNVSEAFSFLSKETITEYKRIFTSNQPLTIFRSICIKGNEYVSEIRKIPIIQNGKVKQILTIIRDITEKKKIEDKLRKSEKKYRNLISNLTDIVIEINSKKLFTFISPQAKTFFDCDPKNILGKRIFKYIHPNDLEKTKQYIDRVFEGEFISNFEFRINQKNDDTSLVSLSGRLIDEEGEKKIVAVIRDISRQRALEKELISREERYRAFIDAATYSFSLWDSNLDLIDINTNGLNFIKNSMGRDSLRKDEVIGRNLVDFVNLKNKEAKEVLNFYMDVLKTGKEVIMDRKPRGSIFNDITMSVRAFKVNNNMMGLISTDISKQKKIENELREQKELFSSIFDNAPIGMALMDLDYNFTRVNSALCDMLGYSRDELLNKSIEYIYGFSVHNINIKELVLKSKDFTFKYEKKLLTKTREHFWTNTTISLLKDEFQKPIFYLVMIEDIRELKKKEEEIKKKYLKFNIEEGNLYLINEYSPALSKTVFEDLQKIGYKGYIISRSNISEFDRYFEFDFEYFWVFKQNSEKILDFINEKSNAVILLDRMEYLFNSEGYDAIIKFIFKLREITFYNSLIVIISMDSSSLTEREVKILEKETFSIEPRFLAKVPEHFLEILRLIYQQNNLGIKPTYTNVKNELEVSRPTLRKRIKTLISTGYLYENIKGKSKVLEISERGRSLFTT